MKQVSTLFTAGVIFLAASCNNAPKTETTETKVAVTDTVAQEEPFVPVDSATAMKAWVEYATPGAMHKMMAGWDGNWDVEATMWMSPDAAPTVSKGTGENKMVMNGLYQESVFKTSMMGMPFEGHSTMGYDNAKKIFVSTWIDNFGSGIMKMEGIWDSTTKTITSTGKCTNPATAKECTMREVFKIIDDNTQTLEIYGPDPKTGKEEKSMEIKYTRAK